jgi:hypothetical protein
MHFRHFDVNKSQQQQEEQDCCNEIIVTSISYLSSAIEGAEMQREERIEALKKLAEYSDRMFNQSSNV